MMERSNENERESQRHLTNDISGERGDEKKEADATLI